MPTTILKSFGAGQDLPTFQAFLDFMAGKNLVALDQVVVIEFTSDFIFHHGSIASGWTGDATRRVIWRPHPSLAAAGASGPLNGGTGLRLKLRPTNDVYGLRATSPLTLDGFVIEQLSGGPAEMISGEAGVGGLVVRNCVLLSTTTRLFKGPMNIDNCLGVFQASSGYVGEHLIGSIKACRFIGVGNNHLLSTGYTYSTLTVSDTDWFGFKQNCIWRIESTLNFVNCRGNVVPRDVDGVEITSATANVTVVDAAVSLQDPAADWRVKPGGPLVGVGSASLQNTLDMRGKSRGTTPNGGPLQETGPDASYLAANEIVLAGAMAAPEGFTVALEPEQPQPSAFLPAPVRDFKAWLDDFEAAGAPDARKWVIQSFNSSTSTTGASAANNSGQARFTLPASAAATTVIGYTTSDNLDIRDRVVYARFDGFSSNVAGVEAYMQVGHDGSNRLRIAAVGGGGAFTAATILGGTGTTVQTATYVGATHRWWGLRYITSTNTIEFLYAASGDPDTTGPGPWTVFHSMPCPSQINPAAVKIALEGRTAAGVATPGYVAFGAFNTKMVTAPALVAALNPAEPLSLTTGGAQQQVVGVITGGDGSPSQYGTYSITGTATVDAAGIVTPPATGTTSGKVRFTPFADASKFVEADYTVAAPLAAPAAPTGLSESSITQTGVTLSWSLGAGGGALAAVKLRYRVQGASNWTTVTLGASATTHPLSGLTAGTIYEWAPGGSNATADTWAATDTFTMAAAPAAPVWTTGATLPVGTAGQDYSQQLVATGATSYAIGTGAPTGWAVSSSGVLTRTAPAQGSYSIPVDATGPGGTVSRTFSVTVNAAAPVGTAPQFTTPAALPAGTAGVGYSHQLAGTGSGTHAYALGANPPAGWAVSSSGMLTGTAPTVGTFEIPVVLTGDTAPPAARTFSVTVAAAAVSPSFSTPPTLPGITAGTAMAVQLATAGDAPQTFTILSGAPAGMVVGSSTGMLTWPNPQAGQYEAIVVQSTNAAGSATRTFSLTVAAAPVVQVPALAVTLQASEDEDTAEAFIRAYHPGTQVSSNVGGSMIEVYKGDTSRVFMFELRTPQGAPVLGAAPSVILSKAGAVFAAGAGQVIDAGGGRYGYWPLPADVDTEGLLVVVAKAPGAIDGIVQATVVQRYGRR